MRRTAARAAAASSSSSLASESRKLRGSRSRRYGSSLPRPSACGAGHRPRPTHRAACWRQAFMALTVVVLAGADLGSGDELSLSLDAPRLVIGRGEGCEIRLPDPSVSHRHASIRQRGADYVLMDEGSDNGTFLGRTRLSP